MCSTVGELRVGNSTILVVELRVGNKTQLEWAALLLLVGLQMETSAANAWASYSSTLSVSLT